MILSYSMFYCTTTRQELCIQLGLKAEDLKWLVNAPTSLMNDDTERVWDYVLQKLSKRIGELLALRNVINHKMLHIRKARVEQAMRKERG